MAKKKPLERPRLIAEQGRWFRFSAYEVVRVNGVKYIRPKHGATIQHYKPLELFPEILEDYLQLATDINLRRPENFAAMSDEEISEWSGSRDKKNCDRVLSFVG